jgi:hypothetical protein
MHTGRRKEQWIGKNGISGERIKEAIGEIERYRKDMITEHCTGYEADIEACSSLIEELSEWYGYTEGQKQNTGEIEALEGEKMEEGSTEKNKYRIGQGITYDY